MTRERKQNFIVPMQANEPVIARWLWLFQDTRQRTLETLEGITEGTLAWQPDAGANTIGTLLYHIMAIEIDWLYAEILERPDFEAELKSLLPYDVRNEEGRLTPVYNESLQTHLDRMAAARQLFLDVLEPMTATEFYRVRQLEPYDVTPEWVLHHLIQHEAEHRGEIGEIRRQYELNL